MSTVPVCRLAPSPTGAQHLGNARTFLLAYWSARSQNARLLLRIEDIDSPRVKPWATAQVIEDLNWLGIEWDGEPVIQTERSDVYQDVLQNLVKQNRLYPCVCSRKDIEEAASAPHEHSISNSNSSVSGESLTGHNSLNRHRFVEAETTLYAGTCANWSIGDAMPTPGSYCLRFRIDPRSSSIDDLVAGMVQCDPASSLGDFPVTRKEGVAAYQLAVVVDDIESGVTEVVRGDDLLPSAFRQNQIYICLGHTPPVYAHVPLVVGEDGRRLAKRHGDTRLSWYREQRMKPEAIVAWAARSAFGHLADFPAAKESAHWNVNRWHSELISLFSWTDLNRKKIMVSAAEPNHVFRVHSS